MTDYRALCAELLCSLEQYPVQPPRDRDLIDRARAALAHPEPPCVACEGRPSPNNSPCHVCGRAAQPEPQGPTLDDVVELCAEHEFMLGVDGANEEESAKGLLEIARAVLARWGADQELEACCEWLEQKGFAFVDEIRAARRPKPQTLNSIAMQMLGTIERDGHYIPEITDTIRRALEDLPDD